MLGVDTIVRCDGRVLGKPADAGEAERMLETLSGKTHGAVSGLCLRTFAWEELATETTAVTFRALAPRDLAWYMGAGEWEGPGRRVRDPGPRRRARGADRRRLFERLGLPGLLVGCLRPVFREPRLRLTTAPGGAGLLLHFAPHNRGKTLRCCNGGLL